VKDCVLPSEGVSHGRRESEVVVRREKICELSVTVCNQGEGTSVEVVCGVCNRFSFVLTSGIGGI